MEELRANSERGPLKQNGVVKPPNAGLCVQLVELCEMLVLT